MINNLSQASEKVTEVLQGKYQVNEIDVIVNTMKETLVSLSKNVEIEMELGQKLRELTQIRLSNSIMSNQLEQEREIRSKIKIELKMYK